MDGKFVYDGKTVRLPKLFGIGKELMQERNDNFSGSGKHEAINIRYWDEITVSLRSWTKNQVYALYDWWSWAGKGWPFSFAANINLDNFTTLDGAAASGQAIIPLTSTAGFEEEHCCLIKQAPETGNRYEVVEILLVNDGVSVMAVEDLKNSYIANDIFRHVDYWPTVVVKPETFRFPVADGGGLYSFDIVLIETK